MMQCTDQMGRNVQLPVYPPKRIISLVPSQTELLFDLGLEANVVGITKFCIHPKAWFRTKNKVGGTKTLNIPHIISLQPDLIIGNKEENEAAQIYELAAHFPLWMSDINTLANATDMIRQIGNLAGKSLESQAISTKIEDLFEQYALKRPLYKPKVVYLIWRKPYMVAAGNTFINEMLNQAGFENGFEHLERYPEIQLEALAEVNPDVIFLSSEPYPFATKHLDEFRQICPHAAVQIVDGEMFSWYGSRLLESSAYFSQLWKTLRFVEK
jgi:ABC-type Fe3+-hydroxamate transport system substrate-binding protein